MNQLSDWWRTKTLTQMRSFSGQISSFLADASFFVADLQIFGGEGDPDGVEFLKFQNYTHLHYFLAEVVH